MDGEIQKSLNEFRQDLVSGEWVLFATGRAKRSHAYRKTEEDDKYKSAANCPFESLRSSGQEILWFYPNEEKWEIAVIKNKYPAVTSGVCAPLVKNGPFNIQEASGSHDVIVYKDHNTHFADFSVDQFISVVQVYKRRYKEIVESGGECIESILIFHNFGREVGASLFHPHSQIMSTPILSPDIASSLHGAQGFYEKHGQRVYDLVVKWEMEEGKRIVYENDFFVVFCPFVSKYPYEVRIFPKDSHAHFEKMPDPLDKYLADAMSVMFKKIRKVLNDPPYNFFVHTASVKEDQAAKFHEFYTWHVEIIPKLSMAGGFELGTGVYVNVIDPDEAAKLLREANV